MAKLVVPGLPGIHVLAHLSKKDVDGRDKPGHDETATRFHVIGESLKKSGSEMRTIFGKRAPHARGDCAHCGITPYFGKRSGRRRLLLRLGLRSLRLRHRLRSAFDRRQASGREGIDSGALSARIIDNGHPIAARIV